MSSRLGFVELETCVEELKTWLAEFEACLEEFKAWFYKFETRTDMDKGV
jgi:hypothetical protein